MAYRILIVDDEHELQNMVKEILTQAGYETDAALSCAQALERFRAAREDGFDAVEFWSWTDKDLPAVKAAAQAAASSASSARSASVSAGTGAATTRSKYFFCISSVRLTRLPRLFTRSVLKRLMTDS